MKETTHISISSGTIIKILFYCTIFAGLFYVRDFVVALLVAVVLASAIEMPVKAMLKWGIPRSISVVILFLSLIISIVSVAVIFIPTMADDVAKFIKTLPQILDSVRIFGKDMGFKDLSLAIQELSRDISKGQILTVIKNAIFGSSGFFATTSVVIAGVFNFVLTFVLAFYLSLEENGVQKFLRLIVPKIKEGYIEDLWGRAQKKIGLWMQGQLLLSLFVALLVYVPSLILNIPYASLLAVLAFIGELIPMVGLTLAMVPALFLAWTHGGFDLLWITGLIYFAISQIESHILYPRVMSKMVGVPSVVVIISIVIGAKIAGIWGVILSVPIASVLMELASDLEKRKSHE
ncbi:MAG: AI-2E family transporter [Candidatus Pacebacteria bacterium]|nr:AI-2E family transporter [Candidatus Paceibacterota bacterium]MBP9866784.1 AI-2E family transporter [Candidatus Paceibacterota bacterium]